MRLFKKFKQYVGLEPSFRDVMQEIIARCDMEVMSVDHKGCLGRIPYRRVRVECFVLLHDDDSVSVSFHSAYRWPPGKLPVALRRMAEKANERLAGWQYETFDTNKHSFFVIRASIAFDELSPEVFAEAVRKDMPLIVKLDDFLEREGLVE